MIDLDKLNELGSEIYGMDRESRDEATIALYTLANEYGYPLSTLLSRLAVVVDPDNDDEEGEEAAPEGDNNKCPDGSEHSWDYIGGTEEGFALYNCNKCSLPWVDEETE